MEKLVRVYGAVTAALLKVLNVLIGLAKLMPRKLLVVAATVALGAIRLKHPDWVLPDAEFLVDLALAFLACHTLTDVASIAATAIGEYTAQRYGNGVRGGVRGGRNGG